MADNTMADNRPARLRNIAIFVAVSLGIGNLGGWFFNAGEGLGRLVFILTPSLTPLLLRAFAGDGWGDAGFRPGFRRSPRAWAIALLLYPAIFALSLGLGVTLGAVHVAPGALARLPALVLAALPGALLLASLEEVGWRGYLDPRLEALGLRAPARYLVVGLVWQLWHVGYLLAQPELLHLPPFAFWPVMSLSMIAMATIYAVLRSRTGSFWPAALAHGIGNALAWPFLLGGLVELDQPALFATRPEGIVVLILLSGVAIALARGARSNEILREELDVPLAERPSEP